MRFITAMLAACFSLFALPAASVAQPAPVFGAAGCGMERSAIKHLADQQAFDINLTPVPSTVDALRALPVPAGFNIGVLTRYPDELRIYSVNALLLGWKIEADRDLHLVIASTANPQVTMIAESIDPACASGDFQAYFSGVRNAFQTCGIVPTASYHRAKSPIRVVIQGAGFWDYPHRQIGAAPNAFELHPITNISLDCPTP